MFTENSEIINAGDMPSEPTQKERTHVKPKLDIYSNFTENQPSKEPFKSIEHIAERIRSGYQTAIDLRTKIENGTYQTKDDVQCNQHKNRLQVVTVSTSYKNKKQCKTIEEQQKLYNQYNYLLQIDIDGVNIDDTNKILEFARTLDYVVVAFKSPRLNPKLFVKWNPQTQFDDANYKETETHHKRAFHYTLKYIAEAIKKSLGIDIVAKFDDKTSDLKRLCFLPFDKDVYLNSNAKPLLIDTHAVKIELEPKPKPKPKSEKIGAKNNVSKIEYIANMILTATVGNRHFTCYSAGYYAGGLIDAKLLSQHEAEATARTTIETVFAKEYNRIESAWQNFKNGIELGKLSPLNLRVATNSNGIAKEYEFEFSNYAGEVINIHYSQIEQALSGYTELARLFDAIFQTEKNIIYVDDTETVRTNIDKLALYHFNDNLGIFENSNRMLLQRFLDELKPQVKTYIAFLYATLKQIEGKLKDDTNNEALKKQAKQLESSIKRCNSSLQWFNNEAMLLTTLQKQLVLVMPNKYVVNSKQLDKRTHYIATTNGVINPYKPTEPVASAKVRSLMITKKINAKYDTNADKSFWLNHFEKMFTNSKNEIETEAIQNVLQYIFQSLAGVVTDDVLLLYGNGRNGKSTLINALTAMFKENSARLKAESFLNYSRQNFEKSDFDFANIEKKRIVFCEELNAKNNGKETVNFIDVSLLKKYTGVGYVQINRKNIQPYDIEKTANFIFTANRLPQHFDESEATYRRLKIVKLEYNFENESRTISQAEYESLVRNNLNALFTMIVDAGVQLQGKNIQWCSKIEKQGLAYQKYNEGLDDDINGLVYSMLQKSFSKDDALQEKVYYGDVKRKLGDCFNNKVFSRFERKHTTAGTMFTNFKNDCEKYLC